MSSPTWGRGTVSHTNADRDQGKLDLDIGREAGTAALGGGKENVSKSRLKRKLQRINDGVFVVAALANLDPKFLPILDRLENEFQKTRDIIENNPLARAQVIAQDMARF